jgi:hypothetical protein
MPDQDDAPGAILILVEETFNERNESTPDVEEALPLLDALLPLTPLDPIVKQAISDRRAEALPCDGSSLPLGPSIALPSRFRIPLARANVEVCGGDLLERSGSRKVFLAPGQNLVAEASRQESQRSAVCSTDAMVSCDVRSAGRNAEHNERSQFMSGRLFP